MSTGNENTSNRMGHRRLMGMTLVTKASLPVHGGTRFSHELGLAIVFPTKDKAVKSSDFSYSIFSVLPLWVKILQSVHQ